MTQEFETTRGRAVKYLALNQDYQLLELAQAIHGREAEHYHYSLNYENYQSLLAREEYTSLPADWPDALKHYRGLSRDQIVAALVNKDAEGMKLALRLMQRDRLRALAACEEFEMANTQMIYETLLNRVSREELLPYLEQARVRREQRAAMDRGIHVTCVLGKDELPALYEGMRNASDLLFGWTPPQRFNAARLDPEPEPADSRHGYVPALPTAGRGQRSLQPTEHPAYVGAGAGF